VRDVEYLASKVVTLRIFEDAQGKMNRDVQDVQGAVLVVSQFTLYADSRKGRRPSFTQAAPPALAQQLYETFLAAVARYGVPVAHGAFGAHMAVSLVNDGPVTIWLESPPVVEGREGSGWRSTAFPRWSLHVPRTPVHDQPQWATRG